MHESVHQFAPRSPSENHQLVSPARDSDVLAGLDGGTTHAGTVFATYNTSFETRLSREAFQLDLDSSKNSMLNDNQTPPYPMTPDGRYFVVRGRLWRMTNPNIDPETRKELQRQLMRARRALGQARREKDDQTRKEARKVINETKVALGERGETWWRDGTPDYNRHLIKNTPYSTWYEQLEANGS